MTWGYVHFRLRMAFSLNNMKYPSHPILLCRITCIDFIYNTCTEYNIYGICIHMYQVCFEYRPVILRISMYIIGLDLGGIFNVPRGLWVFWSHSMHCPCKWCLHSRTPWGPKKRWPNLLMYAPTRNMRQVRREFDLRLFVVYAFCVSKGMLEIRRTYAIISLFINRMIINRIRLNMEQSKRRLYVCSARWTYAICASKERLDR
jgi:hypothetical protein